MNLPPVKEIDKDTTRVTLPPLIQEHLSAGSMAGNSSVIEEQFQTIKIYSVTKLDQVDQKFHERYETTGEARR